MNKKIAIVGGGLFGMVAKAIINFARITSQPSKNIEVFAVTFGCLKGIPALVL